MTGTQFVAVARTPARPAPKLSHAAAVAELAAAREAVTRSQAGAVVASQENRATIRECNARIARARQRITDAEYELQTGKAKVAAAERRVLTSVPAWLADILDQLRTAREHLFDRSKHSWIIDPDSTRSPAERELVFLARDEKARPEARQAALQHIVDGEPARLYVQGLDAALVIAEKLQYDSIPNPKALTKALAALPAVPCVCLTVPTLTEDAV